MNWWPLCLSLTAESITPGRQGSHSRLRGTSVDDTADSETRERAIGRGGAGLDKRICSRDESFTVTCGMLRCPAGLKSDVIGCTKDQGSYAVDATE